MSLARSLDHPAPEAILSEDLWIPSGDPGIELFLRNKRPASLTTFSSERTLLFVHGGSQAAEVTFDLELDGLSWVDYVAAQGWDVWLVDIRGFGKSTRPPEFELPPEQAPPIARTATAWNDFGAAVHFILKTRGIDQLNALGWSWGTLIAGGWASHHPGKIARLVLFGPAWGIKSPAGGGPGYVRWTVREAFDRLQSGAPPDRRAELTPPHWYAAWSAATIATDDQAHNYDPPQVRSPAGALTDLAEAAASGKPIYDPSRIDAATLVVVGEWDGLTTPASAHDLYTHLTGAPEKHFVEIGGATHFAHLERKRLELFSAVQSFLVG